MGVEVIENDDRIDVIIEVDTSEAETALARISATIDALPRDTLLTRMIHGHR